MSNPEGSEAVAERVGEAVISSDLVARHAELSEVNERFLAFLAEHPEGFEKASFGVLEEPHPWVVYPLQAWPLFVDHHRAEELRRASAGLARLIQSLPQRLFGNDAEQLAEFTGFEPKDASFFASILADPGLHRGLLARGDFVLGPSGFQCLEMNMSTLGGLGYSTHEEIYRRVPLVGRFLAETGLEVEHKDNLRALLQFLLDECLDLAEGGELNVVIAVDDPAASAGDPDPLVHHFQNTPERREAVERRWRDLIRERDLGIDGRATFCWRAELHERGERLYQGTRRIHGVVEYYNVPTPRDLVIPWLAGNLRLFNGPPAALHSDKRNLALLSELAPSDVFSAEERRLVEAHVPWTRRLRPRVRTSYAGRRRPLERIVLEEKDHMVLKPSHGFSGRDVFLGPSTSKEEWERVVERALAEGSWIAQEYVRPLPLAFRHGECGWAPHDVVWGIFAFGEVLGGSFLRLLPSPDSGVISAKRGATEGLFFET